MSTYTAENVKDLSVTTPTEDSTPPPELNDSDREIKRVIKNLHAVRALTSGRTLDYSDHLLLCDATSAGFDVTLPAASSVSSSSYIKEYIIQKIVSDASANAVTIKGTVGGVVDPTLTSSGDTMTIIGDGTSWHKVASAVGVMSGGTIDGGTIGGTTAPVIYGKMPVIVSGGSIGLTAAQCYGTFVELTGAGTVTLPAGVQGMNLVVHPTTTGAAYIDPNGAEAIALNGTSLTGGWRITTTTAGNSLGLVFDGTRWVSTGYSSWTSAGS
jgi:hypothetical protein